MTEKKSGHSSHPAQAAATVSLNHVNVPMRWVFILLSASGSGLLLAVGIGMWSAQLETKLHAAEVQIQKNENAQDADKSEMQKYLRSIDERLSHIEGSLGISNK